MKISRKQITQYGLFTLAAIAFSSCNRGVGCPMDFSFVEPIIEGVQVVINFLF